MMLPEPFNMEEEDEDMGEEGGRGGGGEQGEGEIRRCLVQRRRRHSMSAIEDCEALRLLRQKPWRSSSFSYTKLPEQRLRLSILKLDGSSFDVDVGRSGKVAELKAAIEEVFRQSLRERQSKISWSHVWSNFCLCYGRYKLIDGKASLRSYGIKDGDELHFVRHFSINYSPMRRLPRRKLESDSQRSGMPLAEVEVDQADEEGGYITGDELALYAVDADGERLRGSEVLHHTEVRLARILRGWLSYTRLWCTWRTQTEAMARPSRFGAMIARELQRKNWSAEVEGRGGREGRNRVP